MEDKYDIPKLDIDGESIKIQIGASLTSEALKTVWGDLVAALKQSGVKLISIDAEKLQVLDSVGAAFIVFMEKAAGKREIDFELKGINEQAASTLEGFRIDVVSGEKDGSIGLFVENIGRASVGLLDTLKGNIAFVGKLGYGFAKLAKKPSSLRWKDTAVIWELAGVNSFWICAMIGVLFGLILSFQSAMPMKQFGAEIYVASLVSMSLFRVLGPFIAAILFAARSGSAFAAEIGTMKVNEEIDALVTMGLDPVCFLALPRIICGFFAVPLLTIFVNLFGLLGMFAVMMSLGYPASTIYQQTILFTTLTDMSGGIFKAFVFGVLVAAVGCLRGLQTTTGSQAVGQAATRAVVSGIVLVVVAEGIFAVVFYVLGI